MTARVSAEALRLTDLGIPVFPCLPNGKAPLTVHGFLDASVDQVQVKEWWSRWPAANLAVPTGPSGFDVLDVDIRASGSGMPAFETLRRAGLLAGAVRIIRTPSSGLHIYYPASGAACRSLKAEHLDFKAAGGYVLVPPSYVVTPDYSGAYVEEDARPFDSGRPLKWEECARLLSPPAPRRMYSPARTRQGNVAPLVDWLRRQTEGNRNRSLFWAAKRAIEDGIEDLAPIAEAALALGLDEREVGRTIGSAMRSGS